MSSENKTGSMATLAEAVLQQEDFIRKSNAMQQLSEAAISQIASTNSTDSSQFTSLIPNYSSDDQEQSSINRPPTFITKKSKNLIF